MLFLAVNVTKGVALSQEHRNKIPKLLTGLRSQRKALKKYYKTVVVEIFMKISNTRHR
ncbi:MAG TPA: hypothetical protein VH500_21550 [Nitrososphaeraceae archaeon]|jgi:hypothetical protein